MVGTGTATRTFHQFMEDALYAPGRGYYSHHIRTVGRRGDFSTSATLTNTLGKTVAGWALGEHAQMRYGRPWHLVEVGGGDGSLAAAVLGSIGWLQRRGMTYHIVEPSPVLTRTQKDRLGGATRRVRWHTDISSVVDTCGGKAVVFSNELVDAFPVELLEWDGHRDQWREVLVSHDSPGHLEEATRPLAEAPVPHSSATTQSGKWPTDGQRIEVHTSYRDWLGKWVPRMDRVALLTIDYGDTFPAIYHRRPRGTLRAYFHHTVQTGADLYLREGKQDITADVNFTDLIEWGIGFGLAADPVITQREFLNRHQGPNEPSGRDHFLADPDGAGSAFKVLVQRKSNPI